MSLLRQALVADPTYLPALIDLPAFEPTQSAWLPAFLDSVSARTDDAGMRRCIRMFASLYKGLRPDTISTEQGSESARLCDFHVRTTWQTRRELSSAQVDTAIRLARVFPASISLVSGLADLSRIPPYSGQIAALLRDIATKAPTRIVRAYALGALAGVLHERGDDQGAVEIERRTLRDPDWQLPGFRTTWADAMRSHPVLQALGTRADPGSLLRHVDSISAATIEIERQAASSGDEWARAKIVLELGIGLLDRGRLHEAVRDLQKALVLVDSIGDPSWRSYARLRLGRALVKLGMSTEAEHHLIAARSLGDVAAVPRVQKEVEHNLLHLYESLGRDADAEEAGVAFVRLASKGVLDPVRMMSARDFGIFLRTRGRIDESRQYYGRMLSDLDSLPDMSYFGGEYRELTGDLEGAMRAYAGAAQSGSEPVRALDGLVRVALATGDAAAARRWAERHDARRDGAGRPESAPLLPRVLWRTSGGDAARAAYATARREAARHGQIVAWAALTTELAELESDMSRFQVARMLADSAADAAKRAGEFDLSLRALAIAARARLRVPGGDVASSLHELTSIADIGDRSASPQLGAEIHRLVAAGAAASGRWLEALRHLRRATDLLDDVASRIAMDPGQAAYRSAQRRAYNDAFTIIVQHHDDPAAPRLFAEWSARRKGRAYAVQFPVDREERLVRPPRGTAIVDYAVLDSTLAALVVTSEDAVVVRLDVDPRSIQADVTSLHQSVNLRVGSSLDANRARLPLILAHRLYRALIAPLEHRLAGATTLVIVPDGILGIVPFDALVVAMPPDSVDERQATFLIDRRVVVNATTSRYHPTAWRVSSERTSIIDPGNAPGADREVTVITSALNGSVTTLRGAQATRSAAIAIMRNFGVLHFAAHAQAIVHDPGASHIVLAPEGSDDGRLGALDIAGLHLNGSLVVISACETANGRVLDGEGVLSLSRSFLRAGAQATVATLWPVGHWAADFADVFHTTLSRSGNAAVALHASKLAMRKRGAPASAWAPYQLFAGPAGAQPRPARKQGE